MAIDVTQLPDHVGLYFDGELKECFVRVKSGEIICTAADGSFVKFPIDDDYVHTESTDAARVEGASKEEPRKLNLSFEELVSFYNKANDNVPDEPDTDDERERRYQEWLASKQPHTEA